MKISIILMSVIILSIFSISNVLAQSSTNSLRECVDLYMNKLDHSIAEVEQQLQQGQEKNHIELTGNSELFKKFSTEACITSYAQTGKFAQLLSEEEQDRFFTLAAQKILSNLPNQAN
jgi:hypothetical protein